MCFGNLPEVTVVTTNHRTAVVFLCTRWTVEFLLEFIFKRLAVLFLVLVQLSVLVLLCIFISLLAAAGCIVMIIVLLTFDRFCFGGMLALLGRLLGVLSRVLVRLGRVLAMLLIALLSSLFLVQFLRCLLGQTRLHLTVQTMPFVLLGLHKDVLTGPMVPGSSRDSRLVRVSRLAEHESEQNKYKPFLARIAPDHRRLRVVWFATGRTVVDLFVRNAFVQLVGRIEVTIVGLLFSFSLPRFIFGA